MTYIRIPLLDGIETIIPKEDSGLVYEPVDLGGRDVIRSLADYHLGINNYLGGHAMRALDQITAPNNREYAADLFTSLGEPCVAVWMAVEPYAYCESNGFVTI